MTFLIEIPISNGNTITLLIAATLENSFSNEPLPHCMHLSPYGLSFLSGEREKGLEGR
jgi:hypothetical protein